jgi:hypothetical protein
MLERRGDRMLVPTAKEILERIEACQEELWHLKKVDRMVRRMEGAAEAAQKRKQPLKVRVS